MCVCVCVNCMGKQNVHFNENNFASIYGSEINVINEADKANYDNSNYECAFPPQHFE